MDKFFAAIVFIFGVVFGFVAGVTSAIDACDETVQRVQAECSNDKHPLH